MHGLINIGMEIGKDGMGSGIIWIALIWLHSNKSMRVCVLTILSQNIIYLLIMVRKRTYYFTNNLLSDRIVFVFLQLLSALPSGWALTTEHLEGYVSDKMPDRLLFYTDYVYDFIHNHIEEYQKNKDFYDHNVIEYAFTYMTDEDGILSMSVFRPVYKEFDPPYNYAFQYEK